MSLLTPDSPADTEPRVDRPATVSTRRPWRAFAVSMGVLVLAALLNTEEMLRTAERQPVGSRRDELIDVATVLDDVADFTGLDRPRQWLEIALDEHPAGTRQPPPAVASPTTLAPTSAPATGPDDPRPTTTVAERRTPTADDRLRMTVAGDSMMQVVGQSLVNLAGATDVIDTNLEYRVSTGLTRPDYFDWSARIAILVAEQSTEVLVVMFGANDAQGMALASGAEPFGTPTWLAEYRRRVSALMDQVAIEGRSIYWVGQPIMRSDDFSGRIALLNEVYASEAARRVDVTYVDAWSLFAVAGDYSAYIDDGGGLTLMRQSDGIHLSRAGGDRLAAAILDAVWSDWSEEAR